MIKEENGQFIVYSEAGKRLSRPFASKEQAEERLKQIEYFKLTDEEIEDTDYKGKSITLNCPEKLDENYRVYSKTKSGDIVEVHFSGSPTAIISKDPSTPAYWNERLSGTKFKDFRHTVFFDSSTKRIRSVRDGVQEYLGIELGIEPYEKAFTVYRSPETISSIAGVMDGLPIIDEHIDPSNKPDDSLVIGRISDTVVIENSLDDYNSTLTIENKANISNELLKLKDGGKKEFSLGYTGKIREHDVYDFEQYDLSIENGHLALVDAARGGSQLTFVDKRLPEMEKLFLDADGSVNLQKVVEISTQLSEAIKTVPLDKLSEVVPVLEEIVNYGKQNDESEESEDEVIDGDSLDMEYEDMEEEDKTKFEDSKLVKSYLKTLDKSFKDSKQFKDAVALQVKNGVSEHVSVVEKARDFLPDTYAFGDKSSVEIMRDAIKTVADDEFTDSELTAAFKMLKKPDQYKNFGDSADIFEQLKDKEL